jgi:hypothetical protein
MPDYRRPEIAGGTYFIQIGVNAQLSLGWMGNGSDGAFACCNASDKIRDRT